MSFCRSQASRCLLWMPINVSTGTCLFQSVSIFHSDKAGKQVEGVQHPAADIYFPHPINYSILDFMFLSHTVKQDHMRWWAPHHHQHSYKLNTMHGIGLYIIEYGWNRRETINTLPPPKLKCLYKCTVAGWLQLKSDTNVPYKSWKQTSVQSKSTVFSS